MIRIGTWQTGNAAELRRQLELFEKNQRELEVQLGQLRTVNTTLQAQVDAITIPTTLPPSGAAGGDLAGSTYPDPVIADSVVTRRKLFPFAGIGHLQDFVDGAQPPEVSVTAFAGGAAGFGTFPSWSDGTFDIQSSGAVNGGASVYNDKSSYAQIGRKYLFRFRLGTTSNTVIELGLWDNNATAGDTNHVILGVDGTLVRARCRNAGVATNVSFATVGATGVTYVAVMHIISASLVRFWLLDDTYSVVETQDVTSNIPATTTAMFFGVKAYQTTAGATSLIQVDSWGIAK